MRNILFCNNFFTKKKTIIQPVNFDFHFHSSVKSFSQCLLNFCVFRNFLFLVYCNVSLVQWLVVVSVVCFLLVILGDSIISFVYFMSAFKSPAAVRSKTILVLSLGFLFYPCFMNILYFYQALNELLWTKNLYTKVLWYDEKREMNESTSIWYSGI